VSPRGDRGTLGHHHAVLRRADAAGDRRTGLSPIAR
jgi:hypothetical protein